MSNNLIITSDSVDYSFYVFDYNKKEIIYRAPAVVQMNDCFSTTTGRPEFRPFGISKDEKNIYIASNSIVGAFDINTFEYKGNVVGIKNYVNSHQILVDGDYIYTCNPCINSLSIFNWKTKDNKHLNLDSELVRLNVKEPDTHRQRDICHINSVCKYENSLFVMCHYFGDRPATVFEIDCETYQIKDTIKYIGELSHDIFVDEQYIYTLSTGEGFLILYDRKERKIYRSYFVCENFQTTWWMRGMKKIDNKILICLSKHFNTKHNPFKFSIMREFDLNEQCVVNDYFLDIPEPINCLQ